LPQKNRRKVSKSLLAHKHAPLPQDIDEGIQNEVMWLNNMGLKTMVSCEGHNTYPPNNY
jgi:predicted ATP-grasp superfamily ATP-dependent carboligase